MADRINKREYASFFQPYITVLSDNDMGIIDNLKYSHIKATDLLGNINEEKQTYRYSKDKWNIKEIIQHIIDAERIFNCRQPLLLHSH